MALPPLLSVEELFADPVFAAATISPDGTKLAYLAPAHGRTNVWVRGVDEEHDAAVCVTHDSRRGIKKFQWTDDPRYLLYVQDTDGNEDWHIFRVDLSAPDQAAVDLTPMDAGSRVVAFEAYKAKPGSILVMMNKRPLFVDAFLIDIATGETTVHHENDSQTEAYLFGPQGETFVMAQAESDGAAEFYRVDADGSRHLLRRYDGPTYPLGVPVVQVLPDGDLLLGSYVDGDDLVLVQLDARTGEETVLAAVPGSSLCTAAIVAQGGPPIVFTSAKSGDVVAARFVGDRPHIEILDADFGKVYAELAKLSDGVLGTLSCDKAERVWVATFIHDREPAVSYLYDAETGASRLLFTPYPHLDPETLAPMTGVSFTARDGLPLHGFLTLPQGVDPTGLPLVLFVHGGPWYHDVWGYNPGVQFLANRGYAVLQVNFRGSSGYGRRHTVSAIREFAGAMHDDLIDAADWAVKQGYADPTRIGIYGGSYGGYAALVGVTVTPDYFAAAVDFCGISSLMNFMDTLPEFLRPMLRNNFLHYCGDPKDPADVADLEARSPITMVDRITTPLLVVQGANDVRVVQAEADAIVEALRSRDVPVEYLLAEDEGHGFQNPENNYRMWRAIERHFGEYLGGRSS